VHESVPWALTSSRAVMLPSLVWAKALLFLEDTGSSNQSSGSEKVRSHNFLLHNLVSQKYIMPALHCRWSLIRQGVQEAQCGQSPRQISPKLSCLLVIVCLWSRYKQI
jgi:hypothetical protein